MQTLTEDERKKIAELLPKLREVETKVSELERRLNKNVADDWSQVVASYAELAKLVAANFRGVDTGEYGKFGGLSLRPRAAQWHDGTGALCCAGALLATEPLPDEAEARERYEHLPEHERLALEVCRAAPVHVLPLPSARPHSPLFRSLLSLPPTRTFTRLPHPFRCTVRRPFHTRLSITVPSSHPFSLHTVVPSHLSSHIPSHISFRISSHISHHVSQ